MLVGSRGEVCGMHSNKYYHTSNGEINYSKALVLVVCREYTSGQVLLQKKRPSIAEIEAATSIAKLG